ncbi:kinase-like protein, partial [Lentithecium fluviatile CBS 122367]
SKVPRTYIVLRTIDCLDLLGTFIKLGYSDHFFPFAEESLPPPLRPGKRSQFVAAQNLVITKSMDLEKGRHCYFQEHKTFPLEITGILGSGGFGQVNQVRSKISFQEYALKRVFWSNVCSQQTREHVKQFVAEIKILKRLKHYHVVEFIRSYTDYRYIGLVVSPVADMDLSTYLASTARDRELRTFFSCLARALEFLRGQCIWHKEIIPSNILVHGGNIMFTNFRLAFSFTD